MLVYLKMLEIIFLSLYFLVLNLIISNKGLSMKKQLLLMAFVITGSFLTFSNSFAMDALEDPTYLNKFFNERQEYLNEQSAQPAAPVEENSQTYTSKQAKNSDKWCDCKPSLTTAASHNNTVSDSAKQVFKFYILSIVLATFCHHLTTQYSTAH